jgi:hypothetical protein
MGLQTERNPADETSQHTFVNAKRRGFMDRIGSKPSESGCHITFHEPGRYPGCGNLSSEILRSLLSGQTLLDEF